MKRNLTKLMAALALLVFMAPSMVMWGQSLSFAPNAATTGSNSTTYVTTETEFTTSDVTFKINNWNPSSLQIRGNQTTNQNLQAGSNFYLHNTTAMPGNITGITITYTEGTIVNTKTYAMTSSAAITSQSISASTAGTAGTNSVTWTFDGTSPYFAIGMEKGGTSGTTKCGTITITYTTSGGDTPSITADALEIAYNTTSGAIEYTVNNPVSGGVLTAATTATWLTPGTVGDESVPFTCEENEGAERSATVVLTYTYNTDQTVTKNVIVTQAANPNGPGSQANPYTVAQARAAIDAGTGTQGVYATGIVSAIPTAWSSQYNNITFNFVDEAGDEDFLQAFRCSSGTGVDASEVAVGDIVVVYGNLTKYNSTYEFGQGCQLVSLTHPSTFVAAPTFNPAGGTYNEAQSVTISCETPNVSIYYTTDGTDPDDESTLYEGPITVSETTTIKAIAYDNNDNASAIASATYNIVTPLTIAEVRALTDGTTVLTSGVVTHMSGTTAYIEDATGAIVVYGSNVPQQGYNITVSGVLTTYKGLREIGSPTVTLGETGTVTPTDMTIEDINADYAGNNAYQARLVRIEEATYNNGTVSQGENSITVYGTMTGVNDGDVVTFTANIGCHDGVQLVNPTDITVIPATVDPTITANNVNIAYDATEGVIEYTINNGVEGGVLTATTSADWIELGEVGETIPFTCSVNDGPERTASVMLTYTYNRETVSTEVTVTQAAYTVDYAELPFDWAGGERSAFEALNGTSTHSVGDYGENQGVYRMKLDGDGDYIQVKCDQQPGKVTIGVKMIGGGNTSTITVQGSADGETFTDIQTLTISGAQNSILTLETTNAFAETDRYVRLYFTKGSNVGVGPITIAVVDFTPSVIIADDSIDVPAEGGNGTISVTYANIDPEDIDPEVLFFEADGETPATYTYDWITITFNEDNNAVYTVAANTGEARTAYFKVNEQSNGTLSNLVTVNQAAYVTPAEPGTWVLTTLADLTEDDVFVIVGTRTDATYGGDYAMPNNNGSSAPTAVGVTVVEGTLSEEPADNLKWNLEITDDGYIFFPNGDTENWLYCTNTNNGVKVGDGNAKHFTLSDGYLTTTETTDQRYIGLYNAQDWRCYTNTTGNIADQSFAFYKKVETPAGIPLFIGGYNNATNPDGGYYLIATPVDGINPANVTNMTTGNFDLYWFNQSGDQYGNEWMNYELGNNQFAFNELVTGMGYLYAHDTDVTLYFDGDPIEGDEYKVSLVYDDEAEFPGYNLVGNSFTDSAYINHDYYVMNEDGDGYTLQHAEDAIAPMQGIFVEASEGEEELTFTKAATEPEQKIVMNVTTDRSNLVDRATIRFGEGRQLSKFMLNPDDTKLYIPQYEEEYAVVRSDNEAEMPVSFKAAENGTYTISFSTDEVEMEYMHLIDNLTGADIDLLATPSYTFEASTTDYANRFNLVYGVLTGVNENKANHFAFFNGSNWTVNNEGEATLQIVDLTGRVLSTETLSGNANINIDQAAGVYMLRLTNGENVMTQKVVVR